MRDMARDNAAAGDVEKKMVNNTSSSGGGSGGGVSNSAATAERGSVVEVSIEMGERIPPPVGSAPAGPEYKVYRRRWFGLLQLTLLNIIVSWDVSDHHHHVHMPWLFQITKTKPTDSGSPSRPSPAMRRATSTRTRPPSTG